VAQAVGELRMDLSEWNAAAGSIIGINATREDRGFTLQAGMAHQQPGQLRHRQRVHA